MLTLRSNGMEKKFRNAQKRRKMKAKKLYSLIEDGKYNAFDAAVRGEDGTYEDSFEALEIYRYALEMAIKDKDRSAVRFLADKGHGVPVMKELDITELTNRMVPTSEDLDGWDPAELKTPFITDDMEIMRILLEHNYFDGPRKVMWTDGMNLYYGEMTPLAAAVASGNADMVKLLEEKEGSLAGFYGDDRNLWFDKDKTNHITDGRIAEIREETRFSDTRLWSPEEAMLMGSGNDITMLDSILKSGRWYGMGDTAIEIDGTFIYGRVHNHRIPAAFYWMSENATLAVENEFPEMRCAYDIQKILESANNVMLATYLVEHENLNSEVIESMIGQLVNPTMRMMTIGMMDEWVSLTDNHVLPFDIEYYDARRKACIETLELYKSGESGFMILTDYEGEEKFVYLDGIEIETAGFELAEDYEAEMTADTDDLTIDWGDWDEDPEDDEPGYEKLYDDEDDWDDEPVYEKLEEEPEEDDEEDYGWDDEPEDEETGYEKLPDNDGYAQTSGWIVEDEIDDDPWAEFRS